LPPRIRSDFYNILKLFFISGKLFSFNGIFEKQMQKFRELLQKGLYVGSTKIEIYVHGLVADGPGRAKTCSHKQHNGAFGCIFCLNEGLVIRRTRSYPGETLIIRTLQIYEDQFQLVGPIAYQGIKERCFLSEFAPFIKAYSLH